MATWTHTVILDGTDITVDTALDSVIVEEAERESALMDVVWRPTGGQQPGLILQTLTLDVDLGQGVVRLFSGVVIRATWDENRQEYALRGSNRLQEHFRALGTEAAVEAALAPAGVTPNRAFFNDPPDDLWEYAQQLLETAPYDVHLDRAGILQLIPWAAGSASHVLDASRIEGRYGVVWEEADAEVKPNAVVLELGVSFERWKVRAHRVFWNAVLAPHWSIFCDWIQGLNGAFWSPPTLEEVQGVLTGGSWSSPNGVRSEQLPFGEPDLCFNGQAPLDWYFDETSHPLTSASAQGYRALKCGIQESYTITLNALAAQTLYGAVTTIRKQAVLVFPVSDVWPPATVGPNTLANPSTDTVGDDYEDQLAEADRVAFLDAAYSWGRTALLAGNRADSRRTRVWLDPTITLADTLTLTYSGISTTSKVRRLRHTLVPLRTEITQAISRGGGADDPYLVPAQPASNDPITYWEAINGPGSYVLPIAEHGVPTYIGSRVDSPDKNTFDPDEEGFFTNAVNYPGFSGNPDQIYDRDFVAHWPAQEEEATGDMEFFVSASFNIATPSDY